MSEFYIVANSFAAPFFSDTSHKFVEADTPAQALEKFVADYKHPAGLYAAACYRDANAEAKNEPALAKWISNHARVLKEKQDAAGSCYSTLGHGPGDFEINHERITVENPKQGAVVKGAP